MHAFAKYPGRLTLAAVLTMVTILAHEIAHYLGAVFMGGADVHLHWADVTYDAASLDALGVAVTSLAGPAVTYAIILWIWASGRTEAASLALGLGACSRNLVLLPFTIKSFLGRDVSGFSQDEVTAAAALGIAPLPLAIVSVALGLAGLILFLTRAYRAEGAWLSVALFLGTLIGIVLWSQLGPVVLPGGRDYS